MKTATTAAAAAADATATLVRSDADRRNRGSLTRYGSSLCLKARLTIGSSLCLNARLTIGSYLASRLVSQDIPDPADRVNHPRQVIAFELAPQIGDEDVGDVGIDVEVVTPDEFE